MNPPGLLADRRWPHGLALILGLGLLLQLVYLALLPPLRADEASLQDLGPTGAGSRWLLEVATCNLDAGISAAQLDAQRATLLEQVPAFTSAQGLSRADRLALLGLAETLLDRWDHTRALYDMALQPSAHLVPQLDRDRVRAVDAADRLLGAGRGLAFEAELFRAWDGAWVALERGMPPVGGTSLVAISRRSTPPG